MCSASIARGDTGQNSTENGWSRRTASFDPKIAASSSRSHAASSAVAISSWTCLENRPKVFRQCSSAGPGPAPATPELTIRQ